jgi:hypothetical protein
MLVRTFRVDCLFCLGQSPAGDALLQEFMHLPWPYYPEKLFIEDVDPKAKCLDVSHAGRRFHEDYVQDRERPLNRGVLFRWKGGDRLADLFLATFGAYPTEDRIGHYYEELFQQYLAALAVEIVKTS